MIPSPSSVSGGSTRERSPPTARPMISTGVPNHCRRRRPCRRRAASARRPGSRRVRLPLVSTTWSRVPCSIAEGGDCPDLAQPLHGTCRQVHPGRARPVHHVDVVVARQRDHKFRQLRVCGQRSEELGPLRGAAGIGQVARYQDHVQRMRCMDLLQPRQRLPQPLVATRTRPSALDAKSVAFADRVDVRQMRDAPRSAVGSLALRKRAGRAAGPWSHRRFPRSARPPQNSRR